MEGWVLLTFHSADQRVRGGGCRGPHPETRPHCWVALSGPARSPLTGSRVKGQALCLHLLFVLLFPPLINGTVSFKELLCIPMGQLNTFLWIHLGVLIMCYHLFIVKIYIFQSDFSSTRLRSTGASCGHCPRTALCYRLQLWGALGSRGSSARGVRTPVWFLV